VDEDEEEDMDEAPATPSPNVSDGDEMETDEGADLLASPDNNYSSSDDDGFQHV